MTEQPAEEGQGRFHDRHRVLEPDAGGRAERCSRPRPIFISANAAPSQYAGEQCNPYFFNVAWQNDNLARGGRQAGQRRRATRTWCWSRRTTRAARMRWPASSAITRARSPTRSIPSSASSTTPPNWRRSARPSRTRVFFFLPGGMGDQLHQAVRRFRPVEERAAVRPGLFGRRGHHQGRRRADARHVQRVAVGATTWTTRRTSASSPTS